MHHYYLIPAIVLKYNRGETLSEEEQRLLDTWREEVAEKGAGFDLFPEGEAAEEMEALGLPPDDVWDKIREGVKPTETIHVSSRGRLFVAAAAVAGITVLGAAMFGSTHKSPKSPAVAVRIWDLKAPGHYHREVANVIMDSTAYRQTVPYSMQLPDGSTASLNYGSQLRYIKGFTDSSREVWVEGEAHFIVTKDIRRPFLVHAGQQIIRVLGTDFNCMNYPGVPGEITVLQGKVRVVHGGNSVELKRAQQAVIKKGTDGLSTRHIQHPEYTIRWMNTKPTMRFDNEELETVVKRVADYYQVGYHIAPGVKGEPVTGDINLQMTLDATIGQLSDAEQGAARVAQKDGIIEVTN